MSKIYNLYCDESCHLENDGKKYMLLGYVSCPYPQIKEHSENIKKIKQKFNFFGEMKWSKISNSNISFYSEIIDYFFDKHLNFRALIVNKTTINKERFSDSFDDFYYKMYWQLIIHKIDTLNRYNIYLDIKDSLSATKVHKLKQILNMNLQVIDRLQNIRSHESLLLQMCDVILGAISYNLNQENKNRSAKIELIDRIKKKTKHDLLTSTEKSMDKFNLFFIDLQI